MCQPKRSFYDKFRKLLKEAAKREVAPDNTILMELLVKISSTLKPVACTLRSGEVWSEVEKLLDRLEETEDSAMKKAYLEKIGEAVEKLIEQEVRWNGKLVATLVSLSAFSLLVTPITLMNYIPWASLLLYSLSPTLALMVLFVGGIGTFFANPLMGGAYLVASVIAGAEAPIRVSLEVKRLPRRVDYEEVRRLFLEFYGTREGEELFRFELYQLLLSGRTLEEALAELWERLTTTKISSEEDDEGGEHVGVRGENERAEDRNKTRHHG